MDYATEKAKFDAVFEANENYTFGLWYKNKDSKVTLLQDMEQIYVAGASVMTTALATTSIILTMVF